MIVRINQLDAAHAADDDASWSELRTGALRWPGDVLSFEVLVLDRDEQSRPLPEAFRQSQLRRLIPEVVEALREADQEIVVRLEGPLAGGELMPAVRHLAEHGEGSRFIIPRLEKLNPAGPSPDACVRVQPGPAWLGRLCADPDFGLSRSVRLTAFAVPQPLVDPLMDVDHPDDERWPDILSGTGFVVGNARDLRSLRIVSARLDVDAVKKRVLRRLMAAATTPAGAHL
jgi:hypothetical protein